MKHTTGIVRQIKDLGRYVIPIEYRKVLDINDGDELETSIEGTSIVIRKYSTRCVLCGSADDIVTYEKKAVCKNCISNLNKLI